MFLNGNTRYMLCISADRDPLLPSQENVFQFTEYPRKLRLSYDVPSTSNTVMSHDPVWESPSFQMDQIPSEMNFGGTTQFYASQPPDRPFGNSFSEVFSRAIDRMENSAVQNFSHLSPLEYSKVRYYNLSGN